MRVILTEKVRTLGNIGEIVNVSQGYARNYLFPKGVAILADDSNKKVLENQRKALEKKILEQKAAAEIVANKLNGLTIELIKKVGLNGKLFGAVTNLELSKELEARDFDIERRVIQIDNPIKSTGEYEIVAKLFTGVEAKFNVKVIMDPKQAEELKKKAEAAAARKKAKAEKAAAEEAEAAAEGAETETETTDTAE